MSGRAEEEREQAIDKKGLSKERAMNGAACRIRIDGARFKNIRRRESC